LFAGPKLRVTIPAVDDLKSQLELNYKRELLSLRTHLDKVKWYEGQVSAFKAVLSDPKQRKDHKRAKRCIEIAERAIGIHKEIVELTIETIGLRGDRLELQRQLEALED
jgi:hypothetical protein